MALLGICHQLWAQDVDSNKLRPEFGVAYTSELQTNFKEARWNNLFELSTNIPFLIRCHSTSPR